MHLVGKIFVALTFLAGVAAVLLLGKLVHIRNERQQAYEAARASVDGLETKFAGLKDELDDERRRAAIVQSQWHRPVVVEADGVAVDEDGAVAIDVGTDVGFGLEDSERQADPVFYAFAGNAGDSVFVGPFTLVESRQTRSLLEPAFAVGRGESAEWPDGQWRFWEAVPPSAPTEVTRLRTRLEAARVTQAARGETFDRQELAVRQASDQLDTTRRRLEGDPEGNPVPGEPEVTDGLAATFASETAARDRALARLAELRSAVEAAYDTLQQTLRDNREVAQRLADSVGSRVARGD